MSIWQIIGCVMLYLACGAVINGIGDIDPEEGNYYTVIFFWPVVLVMLVLIIVSTAIRVVVHGFKKQFDEQEDM
jgi:uncharacterized membrane protein